MSENPPDLFATTRWTAVLTAGRSDTTRARQALADLCQAYWYPLYAYARRRGHGPHDAEDLTQGFFERLLELKSLASVTREKGKFRAFLLGSMNHYLAAEHGRATAQKRDRTRTLSLDVEAAEHRYLHEPVDERSPEIIYDRQWAMTLLETVVQRLHREYESTGRGPLFMELRFTIALEGREAPYPEIASRLAMTEEAVRVAVHRLRKRYRQMLREEIAHTGINLTIWLLFVIAARLSVHHDTPATIAHPSPSISQPVVAAEIEATPALLAELPRLRFLAWQGEWDPDAPEKSHRAFHPDGSTITEPPELRWLKRIRPGKCDANGTAEGRNHPAFLHVWFSHPLIDRQSTRDVTLLGDAGNPIPTGAGGLIASGTLPAETTEDPLGWLTSTFSPGTDASPVTVRLRYSLGPWEWTHEFKPDQQISASLGNGSQFNAMGQDVKGRAFFSISIDMKQDAERQFGVVAVTTDGRELPSSGGSTGGGVGQAVHVQQFGFDVPLAEVAMFRLGTRPMRTAEFRNVVLPGR